MTRFRFILVLLPVALLVVIGGYGLRLWLLDGGVPNIIVISLDTCRADHVGCYGHPGETTPYIDAIAREGVLFANVITPVPLTLPAHSSMLTGTIPPYHGAHDNISRPLPDSSVTLAEVLREHGYATAGVVGSMVLKAQTGISQGFETFDDRFDLGSASSSGIPERAAGEVSWVANAWLDEHALEPFFLFVHYYDPHDPYEPPEPFASRFAGDPYSGEIAYTDQCTGEVIDTLKRLDFYDSSIIVITSDHGEGLGEHGEPEHGYFIYHSTTKVPLIVKLPGRNDARRVDKTVALIDIVPTLLAQVGFTPPPDIQGEDLSPLLSGEVADAGERFIYSESMRPTKFGCSALLGVETQQWKYIQTSQPELYDLTHDPGEMNSLVDEQPRRVQFLQQRLAMILEEHRRSGQGENTLALDAERIEQLRSLGYTGGPVQATFEFDTDKEDPKSFLEIYNRLEVVDDCLNKKDFVKAQRVGEETLALRPGLAQVHRRLGQVAIERGDQDAAIFHYSEALRREPDSTDAANWHNNLGIALFQKGRFDEAVEHYYEGVRLALDGTGGSNDVAGAATQKPGFRSLMFSLRFNLGAVLLKQGEYAEAAHEFREATSIAPRHVQAYQQLSVALSKAGRKEEADAVYQEALRLQNSAPGD